MTPLLDWLESRLLKFTTIALRPPEWISAVLIIGGCVALIFGRLLLRPHLMIWGSDFLQFYFWENFTREELAAGRLPLWNPYFFSGYPSLANPQTMALYPVALALRLLPISYAFGLGIALHLAWGGLGLYAFVRRQQLSRTAALVSAIAFMLSGVTVPHITGGHVEWLYTLGWLPWTLLCWQAALAQPGWRSAAVAGIASGLMIYTGALRVLVCAGMLVAIMGAQYLWSARGQYSMLRLLGATALALLIMLGVSAPQVLPSLEFALRSSRAAGLPIECAADLSLQPSDLLFAGFPRLPAESSLEWERHSYVGAAGLLLAVAGLFSRPGRPPAWKATLIAWGAAGVLLGLGPALPFWAMARALPVVGLVRQPFTFVVLYCLAGAGLAGLGVEALGNLLQQRTPTRRLQAPGLVLLAAAGLVVAVAIDVALYRQMPAPVDPTFYGRLNWLAQFSAPRYLLAGCVLVWRFGGRRWLTGAALVGLTVVDLWLFAYGRISFLPALSPEAAAGQIPIVSLSEGRVLTVPYTFSNRSMARHTGNAQGYAPIVLETYRAFNVGLGLPPGCPSFENAEIDSREAELLRLLGVQYVVDSEGRVAAQLSPPPRALWLANTRQVASYTEAIANVRRPGYVVSDLIFVEGHADTYGSDAGEARLVAYGTQSVTIAVESRAEGWLYLNDVWYPGWEATVNGAPERVYRANGTFRAVPMPAGSSLVQMQFRSTYLAAGLWIAGLTLAGLAIAAIRSAGRPAKPPVPASSK